MLDASYVIGMLIQEGSLFIRSSVYFQIWQEDLEETIPELFSWVLSIPHFLPPLGFITVYAIDYFNYSNIWHGDRLGHSESANDPKRNLIVNSL